MNNSERSRGSGEHGDPFQDRDRPPTAASLPSSAEPTHRGNTPGKRTTVAEARAAVARMEPILQIEGREISERDKDLTVELICGTLTFEELQDHILCEAGYRASPVQRPRPTTL